MGESRTAGDFLKGLSADQYSRISALLDESIDMIPSDRERWLAALERNDAQSGAVLRSMFAARGAYEADRFLEDIPTVLRVRAPLGMAAAGQSNLTRDMATAAVASDLALAQRDTLSGFGAIQFARRHWLEIGLVGVLLLILTLLSELAHRLWASFPTSPS